MTAQLYLQCFIIGLVGILFHVFVIKLPSVKERSRVANKPFSIQSYLADDWVALGASLITLIACLLFIDEVLKWRPNIINYIKFGFLFVGYTGSSILLSVLSQADKKINSIVDKKTDIADGK